MVLVLFVLSFGGSLEGVLLTPSNKEKGLCPRSNKGSIEWGIFTPSNKVIARRAKIDEAIAFKNFKML